MLVGAERAASNFSWRREPPRRKRLWGLPLPASPAGVFGLGANQQLDMQKHNNP